MKDFLLMLALLGDKDLNSLVELGKEHSKTIDTKDFPQEILDKMMDNQELQGNKRDQSVFEDSFVACKRDGGFNWNESPEGGHFWGRVSNGIFDEFYEKYPKTKTTATATETKSEDRIVREITEDDAIDALKDFPLEIITKMVEYCMEKQDKTFEKALRTLQDSTLSGFVFANTKEGAKFWHKVNTGNFDVFFEKYPKETSESLPMPEPAITHLDPRAIGDLEGFPSEVIDMMLEKSSTEYKISETLETLQKHRKAASPGFTWSNSTEGHSFWDDVISDRNFDVFFEKYPKGSDTDIDKTPVDPEFPCLMEVSDYENFSPSGTRVVFMKKQGKYLAWHGAKTLEEADKELKIRTWGYARPIQKQQL